MIWLPGKIVRFKGKRAEDDCAELSAELHGSCKRSGNDLEITKACRWALASSGPRDESERVTRDDVFEYGANGHAEALKV